MTNQTDRDKLLDEVLGDDLRASSLAHTLAAVRRTRRMRSAVRGGAALALLAATIIFLFRPAEVPPTPILVRSEPMIRTISDDELLAHFPGRAVALVGPPEHRQLIFLDVAR